MPVVKVALVAAVAVFVTACGHVHSTQIAAAPNPPPPPGFQATCMSMPLPFNGFISSCTPAVAPAVVEERVVRAKG
jgi:hypothetical protein